MKYWLIFMLFNSEGEFVRKVDIPTKSARECVLEAAKQTMYVVNRGYLIQPWCVTDDHYEGRKQDPGIPYD